MMGEDSKKIIEHLGMESDKMMSLQRIFGDTGMGNYSIWETLVIGMIALLAIFWFSPGIKAALERGKQVQADWPAVLIPLGVVALFVFFLILAA
jgi:hypothetical protein